MRLFTCVATLGLLAPACSSDDEDQNISLAESINVDALHVGANGTLYAAEGFQGTRIFTVASDGTLNTVAESLAGPIDIASAPDGTLYVTNFNSASVSRVSPAGEVTSFASVNPFPSGIVRASNGDLFVTHYGAASNGLGTGDTILRITESGDVSVFSSEDKLQAPVGVALGDDGTLYTANFHDGRLLAIDSSGIQTEIVDLAADNTGFAIGHVEFSDGDIFATAISDGALIRVDLADGSTTQSAPGTSRPNGIAADPSTGRLFVAPGLTATNVILVVEP